MKYGLLLALPGLLILLAGCSDLDPEIRTITNTVYEKERIDPFSPARSCDRGVDFAGSECDRKIDDHSFWIEQKEVEVDQRHWLIFTKEVTTTVNVVYEFIPPEKPGPVGQFRRAVYLEDPDSGRVLGLVQTGDITRISHEAIDFHIKNSSCPAKVIEDPEAQARAEAKLRFTKYYTRSHDGKMWMGNQEPMNALEMIVAFPLLIIDQMFGVLHELFTEDGAEDVFQQELNLEHYYFSLNLLPVEWGCSSEGEFHLAPPRFVKSFKFK